MMTWGQQVVERLRSKASGSGKAAPVEHEGWQVHVEAEAVGPVGVSARRVHVRAPQAADPAATGREVAGRVKYLLEPLKLLEATPDRALLRSAPPEAGSAGETREYYEMWITRGGDHTEVDLRRYSYSRATRQRSTRPLDITWEVAGRLLDDVRKSLEAAQERSTASPST